MSPILTSASMNVKETARSATFLGEQVTVFVCLFGWRGREGESFFFFLGGGGGGGRGYWGLEVRVLV